jgi:glutamate synthase (NADPH/NADH) small chain
MNKIIAKKSLSEDLVKLEIRTPIAANEIKPGRYILLIVEKDDPGIPVAVVKTNPEKETVSVLVSISDKYSQRLAELNPGNELFAVNGPFGYAVPVKNFGTVLCVSRGCGIVMLLPVLAALHASGNRIVTILSAQTPEGILLQSEINAVSDEVIAITDNESSGEKGSLCKAITQTLRTCKISQMFVVGSATTIKNTCVHAINHNIPTQAILYINKTNIKTGHGIYKVSVSGTSRAVCVDGYDFNAWYPNLEEMIKRFGREEEIPCKTILANESNIPA